MGIGDKFKDAANNAKDAAVEAAKESFTGDEKNDTKEQKATEKENDRKEHKVKDEKNDKKKK